MKQERPPPFPPADGEATQFVSAMEPPPPPPPMPREPVMPRQETQHTNTRFAVPIANEGNTDMGPAGRQRRQTADARIRQPAPAARRPTLLPNLASAQQVRGPKTIRPGVDNPIAVSDTGGHGFGENSRESSDIISSFQPGAGGGDAQAPAPHPLKARPRPRRPSRQANVARPGRQPSGRQGRAPQGSGRQGATRAAPGRKPPPRQTYNPPPRPSPPPALPLNQEHLGLLIADQRRRLHVLFGYARGLEIAAGVLGTLSLAVLIASLVSILLGSGSTVVASASALAGSATGLALTLLMVVGAVGLRQLAHSSAQIAALIEALCQPPNF